MNSVKKIVILLLLVAPNNAYANDVTILRADFQRDKAGIWSVDVTLEHADSGWEHYADEWRIVDRDGNVFGSRVLLHPHEDEQPFTRGLMNVALPTEQTILYIEAHDKVHGWSANRLEVDMKNVQGNRLSVTAK